MEEGYRKEFTENEYPFRVFESFRKGALELVLTSFEQDSDILCSGPINGFEIFFTVPGVSSEEVKYFHTDLSEDTQITIKPKIRTTSKELYNYEPLHRRCFFNSDRQLRFFKSYDWGNCFIECLANFTEEVCGCTRFSMPSMYRFNY